MSSAVASKSAVSVDPEILGGAARFPGTRVPLKALFDCLRAGDSIEQFLDGFEGVNPEHIDAVLNEAMDLLDERHGARPF